MSVAFTAEPVSCTLMLVTVTGPPAAENWMRSTMKSLTPGPTLPAAGSAPGS